MTDNPDSFAKLKALFQIDNRTNLPLEEAWSQAVCFSPNALIQLFDFDGKFKVSSGELIIHPGSISAEVRYSRSNHLVGHVEVSFLRTSTTVEKLFTTAKDPSISVNFGSKMFSSLLNFSAGNKMDMEVNADYEVGPRFWAQMGFKIDDYHIDMLREKLKARMEAIAPSIAEKDAEVIAGAERLLDNKTQPFYKILSALADLNYPVTPLALHGRSLRLDEEGKMPLGLALLSGRDMAWKGRFDIRDSYCLEKASSYLEKKRIASKAVQS